MKRLYIFYRGAGCFNSQGQGPRCVGYMEVFGGPCIDPNALWSLYACYVCVHDETGLDMDMEDIGITCHVEFASFCQLCQYAIW